MFRALSTRRSGCSGGGGSGDGGYERLADESSVGLTEAKLKRVTSLPVKLFGSSSRKLTPDQLNSPAKQAKKVSKIHPLFGLFDMRRRKKNATAKPEVARYMEYVKEGGSILMIAVIKLPIQKLTRVSLSGMRSGQEIKEQL